METHLISHRDWQARIATKGAALIALRHKATELIADGFNPNQETYFGAVLAPWPNRLRDGSWTDLSGKQHQLPCNETQKNNAHHGLVFDSEFAVAAKTENAIRLTTTIRPRPGYPFEIELSIEYLLGDSGLRVNYFAKNSCLDIAPFAIGFHPYFAIGGQAAKELQIRATAKSYSPKDGQSIPIARESVFGTRFDLSNGVSVEKANLDDFFTDLDFSSGVATTQLIAPTGDTLEIWQDRSLAHLTIYTTQDTRNDKSGIWSVAIEPSSAATNAFASGDGLTLLAPGESASGSWGISFRASRQ